MRFLVFIIALLAGEVAYATPVPRPRPQTAPVSAMVRHAIAAVPTPRARPAYSGVKPSPGGDIKQAEMKDARVASAVPGEHASSGTRVAAPAADARTLFSPPVKQDVPVTAYAPAPELAPSGESTEVKSGSDVAAQATAARLDVPRLIPPPETTVAPLKSNGPAAAASLPAEAKADELPVQMAQLSLAAPAIATALKKIPAPRRRPLSAWPRPDDLVMRDVTAPTPEAECDAALNSGILVAQKLQRLGHRGSCMVPYALRLDAIMVGRKRVDILPPAQLRCGFALAVANWVRAEVEPAADKLGSQLVGIRQLDSYNCRTMSSTKRLMSEHSMGNALDVAEFIFANRHRAHLTNRATQKAMRYRLRATACRRFKTVLGPGVPQHHDHIHIDLRRHFGPGGICHWNVL